MGRVISILSKGMLIVGGLMILAGLGWGIWVRVHAPPPPAITDAGAVVAAVTAPVEATAVPPTPTLSPAAAATTAATPQPAPILSAPGPTPVLLPEWQAPQPSPDRPPASPAPTVLLPTPSPTPTPAWPPPAPEPPTRIVAPTIGLDASVVPMGWEMVEREGVMVSAWIVPQKAAGWHINSALPGQGGNVVLSGHHNIEGKVFRHVVDLKPGDEIRLYVHDVPYVYIVTEKYILKEAGMPLWVRQKNAQWILPTEEERLTLVTCWPYEWPGNTHRVIVVARPANSLETLTLDKSQ